MKDSLRFAFVLCLLILAVPVFSQKTSMRQASKSKELLVFTTARDGNFEVYLMKEDSSLMKNLTNAPSTDYGLGWTPDGSKIVFYSDRTGNDDIWIMGADGTAPVNLTNHPGQDRNAAVSPDGTTIAFTSDRDQQTNEIFLMGTDGSNVRQLTHNHVYCESPAWTMDGKQIVFTRMVPAEDTTKPMNGELFIMNMDGSNQKRLTNKNGFDSGASISPNGKQIAFYGRSETGKMDIWTMNLDGSRMTNLTLDDVEDYSPSWSSDGRWIAYTSGGMGKYDLWKIQTKTKQKVRLTSHPKRDESPLYAH